MLVLRRWAAGLLLAGGIVGAGIAINGPPGYAADPSLAVSPGQGGADAQFTATYRWPAAKGRRHSTVCAPGQITFEWDGSPLGRAAPAPTGGTCVAALRAAAPPGAYQGASTHTITVTNDRSVRATYTVTARPAGPPSADASPAASYATTESAVAPQATGLAGEPATSAAPADGQSTGIGAAGWLIAFGTVLLLGGMGMFGMIVWRARHPGPDAEALRPPPGTTDTRVPAQRGETTTRRPAHRAR